MTKEINHETILSSTTMEIQIDRGKRPCIIVIVILSTIVTAVLVIPPSIILTRKTTSTKVFTTITRTKITEKTVSTTMAVSKPANLQVFKRTNETVYAIWNTTAGGNSTPSLAGSGIGTYWSDEPPEAAFDGNTATYYTNHGMCGGGSEWSMECGLNSGFYLTLATTRFILVSFRIAANARSWYRDPLMITIEGSNHNESELTLGNSWTLIYNGSTGLKDYPGILVHGTMQTLSNYSLSFASFRLLVTSKRNKDNSVSYSEFMMIGLFEDI